MAEEISKPLCAAHKVTMVSSGAGEVGAAKLSGEVMDIMTRVPDVVEKLTGVSISQVKYSSYSHVLCSAYLISALTIVSVVGIKGGKIKDLPHHTFLFCR